MVRIPGPLDVLANPNLQTTRRIPSTDTGGAMVGAAMQQLGTSIGQAGRQVGNMVARGQAEADKLAQQKKTESDKYDVWKADQALYDYQQRWTAADEAASLGADEMGMGYHDSGVAYATKDVAALDEQIRVLTEAGNEEQAARLMEAKRRVELSGSTTLRQSEFKIGRDHEVTYLEKLGETSLAAVGKDVDANDLNRSRFVNLVEHSRFLSKAQKVSILDAQNRAELAREFELARHAPEQAAQLLGLPRPAAGLKQNVYDAAVRNGVNPRLALATVQMESAFDSQAVNGSTGAFGLFQTLPRTARELGGVKGAGVGNQIQTGMRYMRNAIDYFHKKNHHRDPTMGEYYAMHLLGKGAANMGAFEDNVPIMQALTHILRNDPNATPANTYGGNPKVFSGVATVGDFRARTEQLMQDELKRAAPDLPVGSPERKKIVNADDVARLRTKITYDLGPKRPHKPQEYVVLRATSAVEKVNPKWRVVVHSGMGEHGSARHRKKNHGRAADIYVVDEHGKQVSINNYPKQLVSLYRAFAAEGMKGLGWYGPGNASIHVDDVSVANWGPDKSQSSLPQIFKDAIAAGRSQASGGKISFPTQGRTNGRYSALTLKDKESLYSDTVSRADGVHKANEKAYKSVYDNIVAGYALTAGIPNSGYDQSTMMNDNRLSPEDKVDLTAKYEKGNKDKIAVEKQMETLAGGGNFTTGTTAERNAAETAFTQMAGDGWKTGDIERAKQVISASHYLPKAVSGPMLEALSSGDPRELAAIGLIADLARNSPELFKGDNGKKLLTAGLDYDNLRRTRSHEDAAKSLAERYSLEGQTKRGDMLKNPYLKKSVKEATSLDQMVANKVIPQEATEGPNVRQAAVLQEIYSGFVEDAMVETGRGPADEVVLEIAKTKFSEYYKPSTIHGGEQPPAAQYMPLDTFFPAEVTGYKKNYFGDSVPVKGHGYIKDAIEPALKRVFGDAFEKGQRWVTETGPDTARALQSGANIVPVTISVFGKDEVFLGTTKVWLNREELAKSAETQRQKAAAELQQREQSREDAVERIKTEQEEISQAKQAVENMNGRDMTTTMSDWYKDVVPDPVPVPEATGADPNRVLSEEEINILKYGTEQKLSQEELYQKMFGVPKQ